MLSLEIKPFPVAYKALAGSNPKSNPTSLPVDPYSRRLTLIIDMLMTLKPLESRGVFGSLTLGGYDSSRLVPNNVSFPLDPDISRDLTVSLQSITATYANDSAVSLLSEPIWTFIDSTTPDLYLPLEVCKVFEQTFGLVWNATHQKYFVDDEQHGSLMADNNKFTFVLGNHQTGGPTVNINLPYSSFDLAIDYPLIASNLSGIRYFPLKRAVNSYTLGRAFLQEA